MKPFSIRKACRVIVAAGLGLIASIAAERSSHASQAEPLLHPTPLVLKDGRIANVSIHVVPFAPGRADLAADAEARVAELTRAVGTDCFLTAQVIGHIDSSEVAQDDTLNAHRLARSRADAVQASLIGGGLPAKAIASVWDWQFMVRAPRATLWVFQLTAGEDCEGRPLHGDMVAQAPPLARQATSAPERVIAPAIAPAERAAGPAAQAPVTARVKASPQVAEPPAARAPVAARVDASPQVVEPPAARAQAEPAQARSGVPSGPQPAAQRERLVSGKPAEQPETATAVAARPALAPKAATSGGKVGQRAEQGDTATVVAAKPASAPKPSDDGKVERSPGGGLAITFATNSSFFPSGAARGLRELIAGLDAASRYEVTLQVAVGGTTKVVGAKSPQEAARYNKWLAERRLQRVHEWLLKNAAADALSIKPAYVSDDDSRQVLVRVAPVG